jgi:hypothetical protein
MVDLLIQIVRKSNGGGLGVQVSADKVIPWSTETAKKSWGKRRIPWGGSVFISPGLCWVKQKRQNFFAAATHCSERANLCVYRGMF